MPVSWSTVGAGEPESGGGSTGDVGEPEADDGAVGAEAEPAQPIASNAATTTQTSDRDRFITAGTSCPPRPLMCRGNQNRLNLIDD